MRRGSTTPRGVGAGAARSDPRRRLRDEKEQRRLWQELVEPAGAAVRHPTIEDIVDTLVTEAVKKAVRP
jgi:hypothetical protein